VYISQGKARDLVVNGKRAFELGDFPAAKQSLQKSLEIFRERLHPKFSWEIVEAAGLLADCLIALQVRQGDNLCLRLIQD